MIDPQILLMLSIFCKQSTHSLMYHALCVYVYVPPYKIIFVGAFSITSFTVLPCDTSTTPQIAKCGWVSSEQENFRRTENAAGTSCYEFKQRYFRPEIISKRVAINRKHLCLTCTFVNDLSNNKYKIKEIIVLSIFSYTCK